MRDDGPYHEEAYAEAEREEFVRQERVAAAAGDTREERGRAMSQDTTVAALVAALEALVAEAGGCCTRLATKDQAQAAIRKATAP